MRLSKTVHFDSEADEGWVFAGLRGCDVTFIITRAAKMNEDTRKEMFEIV